MRTILLTLTAMLTLMGCSRPSSPEQKQVVLYSSVDEELLRQVVAAFEQQTGVRVLVVGDNEAVKTTGLVQRVLAEKARPQADVWWSSEPFGTIRLSRQSVLAPYTSVSSEAAMGGWPADLRGGDWYGFALRFRVLGYANERVDQPPQSLAELTAAKWKGRVGMARPQFGTTRGHMGVLLNAWGSEKFRSWLELMRDNDLRLYDGNASCVRALRQGEIDLCLTDSDDVWSGQRNGWKIDAAFEDPSAVGAFPSTGPIAMPNTIGLVRGGPHEEAGKQFIDFVLGGKVTRMMAESDSHNLPVYPALRGGHEEWAPAEWNPIDYGAIESKIDEAMAICEEVLK